MQQSDSIRRASGLRLVYSFITASALLGSLYISRADCVNPPSGLVSWWRAEGNGADVVGAHEGSFPYGSLYATGKVGQAWDFDGGSRRLSVPDSPDFKLTNAMTLEAWVYPRAYDGFLFFRGDNRGGLDSFVMDLYTPGVVKFQIDDASNNYAYVTAPLQLNQWQHVAGTWDRASGSMKVYVNGVLGGQTNTALIPLADLDPAQEPGVGLGNHAGTFHEFGLNGLLDEPAIYSRALSASEILAIYEAGTGGKCVPPPLLVVPNYLKTNETTSASGTLNHAIRIQEVYLNTEFPNQPIRIKELRFRPSAQWGNAFSVVVSNLQVKLSTTSKAPYGLSSTFAENIGSNETTVFSGSLPISSQFTGPANGPKDFDIIIPLQTPFVYNPAQGNLLLDLRNPDNSGGSHLSAGSGLAGGSRAFSGNADSPSATTVDSGVDALGIVFEPVVSSPSVLSGPVTNSANGHVYYLLSGSTWTDAEAKAIQLGGHLVTINDEAENAWVFSTFGSYGGTNRELWIGLNDAAQEGAFVWASGEPVSYTKWYPGDPNNYNNEDYGAIWAPVHDSQGRWADWANIAADGQGNPICGVVEVPVASPPSNPVNLPSDAIAWWRAEGNALDALNAHDGSFPYGSLFVTGKVGQAWDFDGGVRRVAVPDSPDFKLTNAMTLEAWVYPRAYDGFLFFRGDNRGGLDSWVMDIYTAGVVRFQIDDTNNNYAYVTAPLQLNQWQHVAGTWDRASGEMKIYVNGVLGGQTNTTLIPLADLDPGQQPGVGLGNHAGTFHEFGLNGLLDEPAIYSRALSAAEILAVYEAGSGGKSVPSLPPTALPPAITDFSPTAGTNGTIVTITGTNFSPVVSNNVVYLGAVRAAVTTASATSVTVVVPPGATYAPPSITVGGLTAEAPLPFLPTYPGGAGLSASNFNPRVNLPAGDGSQVVRIADLNSDGRPDLAVNNVYGRSASLFRNLTAGGNITTASFQLSATLPAPFNTYYTRVADLDGDGKLDVLVANLQSNSISIFRNISAAGALDTNAFAPRVDIPVGPIAEGLAVQDLDLDGRPDVIVVNQGNSTVSVLRNLSTPGMINGSSFAPKVDFPVGSTPHDVGIVDLDGDRRPEIVTADFGGASLSILRNLTTLGGGIASNSFAPRVAISMPSQPRILNFGDMDGDGRLDLVVACWSGGVVSVRRNLGTGTISPSSFAAPVNFAVSGNCNAVALGDLDGDGKPDIAAVTDINSHLSVFRNVSAPGSFTTASLAPRFDLPSGSNPQGVCIGDLNADGLPDIVFANANSDSVSIYQNRGPLPPSITQHPASQTAYVGDQVTLAAAATGSTPLSYQWWFGGNALQAGTNASLVLPSVQVADAGSYWVTVSNLAGNATSSNAVLSVLIPECTPVPAGLVGWWRGEETPEDAITTNDAAIYGGNNYAAGRVGAGFEFKGHTNFARIPAAPALNVSVGSGLTIEGWIYPRDIAGFHPIWEWSDRLTGSAIGAHLWIGRLPSSNGELFANIVGSDNSQHPFWTGNGVLAPNVWQHVALTYDKTSGIARILRNGQVVAQVNLGSFTPKTDIDVFIGRRPGDSPGDWTYNTWFNGVLDELSLYDRALGTNEIAAIYAARGEGKCALPPTVLAVTPPSALVNEGETVSFTVSATGVGPLSYQWQHGGVDLAGANAATLVLSNIAYAQAGNYRVAVSNAGGVTLSSNVVLTVNRLPLADAGATDKLLISPNGSNVIAVLDGSLSSDPDGNALTYAWFHTGDASPFASGVVAVTVLPVGTNDLTLMVSDGMASASQAFAVEVITTADAVDRLITLVQTNVDKANALVASLRAALAAIDRSQPETAINQLEAFINKVQAQLEPTDPALAAQLIADAQAIIDALNGGGAPAPAATVEITSITQGSNGKPHLKIKGLPGRVHIVETSTDMVNWVKVGVAAGAGGSDYRFDDTQAPAGGRFYRVVSPK